MADSSIPLRINVPQIETGLEAKARGLSLQQLAQGVESQKAQAELNRARVDQERIRAQQAADDKAAQGTVQNVWNENGGDYEKTRKALIGRVPMKHVKQFDDDYLSHQKAALALTRDQREAYQATVDATAQEAARLLELPPEKRGPETLRSLERLKKAGVDTSTINYDPITGPSDDELQAALAGSKYNGQVLSWANKQAQADLNKKKASIADQEEVAKEKTRMLEDAARSHLGVTSQEEHNEWLAGLDPKVAPIFKNLKKFSPEAQSAIQGMPMTASQRATQATKDEAAATNAEYRKAMAEVAKDRAAVYDTIGQARQLTAEAMMLRAENAGNKNPQNDMSVRQARTQYQALSTAEGKLNALRYAIGAAAKSRVDADGKPLQNKDKSVRDFDAEMKAATDELSRVVTEKYDAAIRAGMGEPKVPLDQALQAIQSGATPQPKQTPPSAGSAQKPVAAAPPSAVAPPPPASRPAPGSAPQHGVSEAELRRRASAAGKDPNAAVELAKKKYGTLLP